MKQEHPMLKSQSQQKNQLEAIIKDQQAKLRVHVASQITHDDGTRSKLAEREAVSNDINELHEDFVMFRETAKHRREKN